MKTYALCIVKATRKPTLVDSGMTLDAAIQCGDTGYSHVKLLRDFVPSGVAVIIVADDDYEKFLTDRSSWGKLTAYQFGSY